VRCCGCLLSQLVYPWFKSWQSQLKCDLIWCTLQSPCSDELVMHCMLNCLQRNLFSRDRAELWNSWWLCVTNSLHRKCSCGKTILHKACKGYYVTRGPRFWRVYTGYTSLVGEEVLNQQSLPYLNPG